jgi:hypothetical protein
MVNAVLVLAQGGYGEALIPLIAMAGIAVVPFAITVWVLWAAKGRPKSTLFVAGLVLASVLFLIWLTGFISYCTMPSPDEEMALEEVESAVPTLDGNPNWSYSAKHLSPDIWIITIDGRTKSGQPLDKKYRVTPDMVEEEQPSVPSGWAVIERWPEPAPPSSQSTSAP